MDTALHPALQPSRGCRTGGAGVSQHPTARLAEGKAVSSEPIGRHLASKRSSGTSGPDDYDVIQDGRDIGRIFKSGAGVPEDLPRIWTITGAVLAPRLLSHRVLCQPVNARQTGPGRMKAATMPLHCGLRRL
jgi:hypothetical protein